MAGYGSQYEEYYKNLKLKGEKRFIGNSHGSRNYGIGRRNKPKGNYWVKRIIRNLVGTCVMFLTVLVCKAVSVPQTKTFYDYSKNMVNNDLDYKQLVDKAKKVDTKNIETCVTDVIERIKKNITGNKTVKEKIREEFILPADGEITSNLKDNKNSKLKENLQGVDIKTKKNANIKATYDGKVKDCGQDNKIGNYILIDHGEGVETKYSNLKEIAVTKGEKVNKGYIIGKSNNVDKCDNGKLHFQLLYMGEDMDPREFIAIK